MGCWAQGAGGSATRFAGSAGYVIVRWYVEGLGSETDGYALSRLMEDVAS